MTIPLIRRALEKRLAMLRPAMPGAYDNASYKPVTGVAWLRATLMPATIENPTIELLTTIERGIFAVSLFYPKGDGPAAAETAAEAVRALFPAGLVLTESGCVTRVLRTPSIAAPVVETDWFSIPVSIRYTSIHQGNP